MNSVERATSSTEQLVAAALATGDPGSHEYAACVGELQRRGDDEVFRAAAALCGSQDAAERRLGADVLARLGSPRGRPYLDDALPLLLALAGDPEPAVAEGAILALVELDDSRGLQPVLARAHDPNTDVRVAVAFSLPWLAGDPPDPRAVACLRAMTADADPDVRGRATAALASRSGIDSPEVRDALAARLDDDQSQTARDALMGLARRRDRRAIPVVVRALEAETVDDEALEAAAELGDPELLPALRQRRKVHKSYDDLHGQLLDHAIRVCQQSGGSPPRP